MTKPYDYTQLSEIVLFDGDELIELSREKQYINLIKPSEIEKRYYRYNLQKKQFERINFYKTKPTKITPITVENARQWFTRAKIITKDLHFGRLILFAKHNSSFDKYSNPVRFIEQLGHPMIEATEQWEALGVEVQEMTQFYGDWLAQDELDFRKSIFEGKNPHYNWSPKLRRRFYGGVKIRPSDLRKDLLQYILKTYPVINQNRLYLLKEEYNNNEFPIEQKLKKLARTPEFQGTLHYTQHYHYRQNEPIEKWAFGTSNESRMVRKNLIQAIQTYHLEPKALMQWLKKQKNVEKNDVGYLFGAGNHYQDYLQCELELKNHKYPKMEKYPDNFRTHFHRIQEEYNILKQEIDENKFAQQAEQNQQLEHTGKKYCIKIPKQTAEICEEANELKHCVRIYIPRMVEGKTLILFLRDKEYPQIPLVTLEVKNGILMQAYGKNDSKPKPEHLEYLKQWVKNKKLKIGCWHNDLK